MPPRFLRVGVGRARRTRVVAAVALVALVPAVAACRPVKKTAPPPPPPPAEYCAPATPTNAGGYQSAFDAMFAANTGGWVASDGGYPFALPDGRVLWFFGDTLVGSHTSGGSVSGFLVNNGFVVQDGPCFRPITKPIPDPVAGEWIWPTGAIVEEGKLRVFGLHMRSGGGSFGFQFVRVDVATFSLPDLAFEGSQALPVPLQTATPRPSYGETVTVVDDGTDTWVYAYGLTKQPGTFVPIPNHYVARAPLGDVMVADAWEFWHQGELLDPLDPSGWTDEPDDASPMLFDPDPDDPLSLPDPDDGPVAPFPVTARAGGDYLGSALGIDVFPSDLETWSAAAPEGPWEYVDVAVDVPDYTAGGTSGRFAYGGRVVVDLPGVAPFGFWSTNHESFEAVLANPELYKVVFATPAASSIP